MWGLIVASLIGTLRMFPAEGGKYELTENQKLRLEVQQSRFALAQEHYQQAVASFNGEVEAIEKENHWEKDAVQFDPNTLTFREIPKPVTPKAPDKPDTPAAK